MNEIANDRSVFISIRSRVKPSLVMLLCLHTAICCISLSFLPQLITYQPGAASLDSTHVLRGAINVASFSVVALFFVISRFSLGYLLGFYFYTMILGYLWLVAFSHYRYDHTLAQISISLSAVAFLAPALFITSPIRQRLAVSACSFDRLLSCILLLSTLVVSVGVFYNFKLVAVSDIYSFRSETTLPKFMGYAIGIVSIALLPFAFACFITRRNPCKAAAALLLLLLLYPVTLTKTTLFEPGWLLFLVLLCRFFHARATVVLSLLLPISFGVALALLMRANLIPSRLMWDYFGTVNIRMVSLPSIALDVYNDFFATHELTYFCQISLLKPFVSCPYPQPLSVVMFKTYGLGNFNASLFATEGIASVGLWFAPLSALICGVGIAAANRLSSGLPPAFILMSGGVLPQVFLNVPLTTNLLTNGAAILFALWYVTPRSIFERELSCPRDKSI